MTQATGTNARISAQMRVVDSAPERGGGSMASGSVSGINYGRARTVPLSFEHTSGRAPWGTGRVFRRLIFLGLGQFGTALAAFGSLAAAVNYLQPVALWLVEALAALMLVRIWYFHTRGPEPVLTRYRIRKRAWRVLVDEGKIATVFLGVCFVMAWPLEIKTALVFVAVNFGLQFFLMSLTRLVIKRLAELDQKAGRSDTMAHKAIIVGTGKTARELVDLVCQSPEMDTRLVGFLDYSRKGFWRYRDIPLIGHPDQLEEIVANSQVDALFWAVEPDDVPRSWKMMETAEKMGVRIFVMPNLYTPRVARVRPTFVGGMPAMVYRSEPESPLPLLTKNLIDRLGAALAIVLAAPFMAITAIMIKLDSRGPILFRQRRLGLNGKPFTLYKFRTMCSDAEGRKDRLMKNNEMSGPVFKIKSDPRVTRLGRFLRKFSIDELPQLFNIIRGEMSLVGPRPPLPQEVSRFEPWQHRKLSVRPGLTCLWQVNGRNDIDFEDWMKLDLEYIDNWSLWLDAKILAKTVPTVMKGSGQ